jgi:hypothetical protein
MNANFMAGSALREDYPASTGQFTARRMVAQGRTLPNRRVFVVCS